jgi:beta-lactamase class A
MRGALDYRAQSVRICSWNHEARAHVPVAERTLRWLGSIQIYEIKQQLNSLVGTTDAVSGLPRGWYFWHRGGTTDLSEKTKTKFEMYNNSSHST